MGCDIHLFVEYRKESFSPGYWKSFGSQFRLGRHYGVFASLADVRNYDDEITPVSQPRGIPEDIGYSARENYLMHIIDDPSDDSNECTKETAEIWVKYGYSKAWGEHHVTDPDAHNCSWLTPDEFEKAINFQIEGKVIRDTEDYRAVLAAMRSLEQSGYTVRTVFWFDN